MGTDRNGKPRECPTGLVFRQKNLELVGRAVNTLTEEQPMTLRQLFYRLVSAGALRNAQKEYKRLGHLMTRMREAGAIPRTWIVDHVRSTLKPSSWTGLADFAETVRDAYRKDFWASLGEHAEVFVEKDAVAGVIGPVTEEYDIRLHVCRGYSSVSFAGEIADLWARVERPIHAYYLGDFDPSGFDLERDLWQKLERYSGKVCVRRFGDIWVSDSSLAAIPNTWFYWTRLAVCADDFAEHDLIALPAKHSDNRSRAFIDEHGEDCAELDALAPSELRRRVEEAITAHIDPERWEQLQRVEQAEQKTLEQVMKRWRQRKLT